MSELNYSVKTSAGEERRNLTRANAYRLALLRQQQWSNLGRSVVVSVFYQPTGQSIPADRWLPNGSRTR